MGRWNPDAGGRLQHAAITLYLERGYEAVTVAEIAERAGLTKRTYFRHFADKREVLFAGADAFQESVLTAVTSAPDDAAPIDAAIRGLAAGGAQLAQYGEFARIRRDLIASATDLQERELIKMAALTAAIAGALRKRGVEARPATLAAHAAVVVFTAAYDRWNDDNATTDLPKLIHHCLDDLRQAVNPR